MQDLVSTINSYVWSDALIYLALGTGLLFSIMTRFVQVRRQFVNTFMPLVQKAKAAATAPPPPPTP